MDILATQKCIEVRQEIGWIEKRIVETSFDMKLYGDMITVKHDHFPINTIFDISYRKLEEENTIGYIYLHTSQGVRTYYIKEKPTTFIDAYLKLKSEHPELQ